MAPWAKLGERRCSLQVCAVGFHDKIARGARSARDDFFPSVHQVCAQITHPALLTHTPGGSPGAGGVGAAIPLLQPQPSPMGPMARPRAWRGRWWAALLLLLALAAVAAIGGGAARRGGSAG